MLYICIWFLEEREKEEEWERREYNESFQVWNGNQALYTGGFLFFVFLLKRFDLTLLTKSILPSKSTFIPLGLTSPANLRFFTHSDAFTFLDCFLK
jgi:hypothetical protein